MKKKILLTLGTGIGILAPIATVVACSSPDYSYSKEDQKTIGWIKEDSTKDMFLNKWIFKALKETYKPKVSKFNEWSKWSKDFRKDFKSILKWKLTNSFLSDRTYSHNFFKNVSSHDAWGNEQNKDGKRNPNYKNSITKILKDLGMDQNFNSIGRINGFIDELFKYDKNISKVFFDIQIDQKTKKVIYNPQSTGIKNEILKDLVVKKFLSISKKEYRKSMLDEYTKLDDAVKSGETTLDTTKNFPLIVELFEKKYAFQWNYSLDEDNGAQFITGKGDETTFNNIMDAIHNKNQYPANIKVSKGTSHTTATTPTAHSHPGVLPITKRSATTATHPVAAKHTGSNSKQTTSVLVKSEIFNALGPISQTRVVPESFGVNWKNYANFIGIKPASSIYISKSDLKENFNIAGTDVKKKKYKEGFLVDGDLILISDTVKDDKTQKEKPKPIKFIDLRSRKLDIKLIKMVLPVYDTTKKELIFDINKGGFSIEQAMNVVISKEGDSLFATAMKYFKERKDSISLEISNKKIKKLMIDNGYDFIKE